MYINIQQNKFIDNLRFFYTKVVVLKFSDFKLRPIKKLRFLFYHFT